MTPVLRLLPRGLPALGRCRPQPALRVVLLVPAGRCRLPLVSLQLLGLLLLLVGLQLRLVPCSWHAPRLPGWHATAGSTSRSLHMSMQLSQ